MKLTNINIVFTSNQVIALLTQFLILDVGLALLPLGIIAVLQHASNSFSNDFWLIQDWSFSAIVIMGLALARALELKIVHQRDSSERGILLALFCAFGLIGAVLSFSLAQLSSSGIGINEGVRKRLQFSVIFFGLIILGVSHLAKAIHLSGKIFKEPKKITPQQRRKYTKVLAYEVKAGLKKLEVDLNDNGEAFKSNPEYSQLKKIEQRDDLKDIKSRLEDISETANRLKKQLAAIVD